MLKHIKNSVIAIPTPMYITYMWNMGSLLGLCMVVQTVSGLFLAIHYLSDINLAFDSVVHISENVNYGWVIRYAHANGASLFFIFCYIHIGRNLYYESWKLMLTWIAGVLILFLLMGTAFLGYVLPWGQMSFWGATVITNLISAIPYFGFGIVEWLWGGYSVGGPTLTRFFSFHFLLPFILIGMIMIHILFLHTTGSSNPLGLEMNIEKIQFHSYFVVKDVVTAVIYMFMLLFMCLMCPHIFMDPDNFIHSNPMVTPIHIQPEWYFLFAYAILRCIPSKLGGVLALLMSILILLIIPLFSITNISGSRFSPTKKLLFWLFAMSMVMLTYLGSLPVEYPFITLSQVYSLWYFFTIIMMAML